MLLVLVGVVTARLVVGPVRERGCGCGLEVDVWGREEGKDGLDAHDSAESKKVEGRMRDVG